MDASCSHSLVVSSQFERLGDQAECEKDIYASARELRDDDDSNTWEELHEDDNEIYESASDNREAFERLKVDPKFSGFFAFKFPDMKVGKKIGQSRDTATCEGEFTLGTQKKFPCVLKIFSQPLSALQNRWPQGMLEGGNSVFPGYFSGASSILGGLVLDDKIYDGQFAIVLRREWGNLQQLIDLRLGIKENSTFEERVDKLRTHVGPIFSDKCGKRIMLEIAIGMQQLLNHGILHKDLRASNVLVCTPYPRVFPEVIEDYAFNVKLHDFELSGGFIVGSVFFRAPEVSWSIWDCDTISRGVSAQAQTTTKSDVYAYGLVCYEILTGYFPFEDHQRYEVAKTVLSGQRPHMPDGMDEWLEMLIIRCWEQDPSLRPEFEDIIQLLHDNVSDPSIPAVDEQIAASRSSWTTKDETAKDESDLESKAEETLLSRAASCCFCSKKKKTKAKETNREIFARLKQDPQYSRFFSYTFHNLEQKGRIAKGGQGEIFEAEFEKQNGIKVPCVMKIFDAGFSLSQLEGQWPPGMFKGGLGESSNAQRFGFMGLYPGATRTCEVLGAVVLEESERFGDKFADRFAFILNREGGDLQTLIKVRMKQPNNQGAPFTVMFATKIMYEIALGMQHLHVNGILHRDLKAANVLVTNVFGEFPTADNDDIMDIKVADFECSMVAVGTNFWRAPEILRQLKSEKDARISSPEVQSQIRSERERAFTRKADVYSYAMTCSEVLTGGDPLVDRFKTYDFAAVCDKGARPILSDCVAGWLRDLISKCWDDNPSERPEFKEIILRFQENCSYLTQHRPQGGNA